MLTVASLYIFSLLHYAVSSRALHVNSLSPTGVSKISWQCLALYVFETRSCGKSQSQEVWILAAPMASTGLCDLGFASHLSNVLIMSLK